MTTIEEIVNEINVLLTSLNKDGFCYDRNGDICIKLSGQYTEAQLNYIKNHYAEINTFWVETFSGYFEIVYPYEGI